MGYGTVAKLFHWLTVLAILVMIPVGMTMVGEFDRSIPEQRALQDQLFILHKGLGAALVIFIAARIVWRLTHRPPPLPDSITGIQRFAAEATHIGLYVLLVTMVVSGYVRTVTGGFPIEWLNSLGIPPLLDKNKEIEKVALFIHETAVWLLIALILAHVGAALMHGIIKKDGVFSRMWPQFGKGN